MGILTQDTTSCYHCGNACEETTLLFEEKSFCCVGCQSVYKVLSGSNLCAYYNINQHPGITRTATQKRFDHLDEPKIVADLIDYTDAEVTIITLYIPNIHCSSCIWLLEHLYKLNPSIRSSRIDFLKKQLSVTFNHQKISLREVVELLFNIGYEPLISLQDVVKEDKDGYSRNLVKKIAVAGFCFGNVMLFSFPEYFGMKQGMFTHFFGYMNLLLSIPVVFYSGREYFTSAYQNIRKGVLNIDFPLALGILVLFLRSVYELVSHTGAGFADSLCGLVFFLLIGKWVQQKTYYHLSFERDYRSYFPVAVNVVKETREQPTPLADLEIGHRIIIRDDEIIPADAILLKGTATIDFSFVTGESKPVQKVLGEIIYAGGRQKGGIIELEVIKPVSQSYLTKLWNNDAFDKNKPNRFKTFNQRVSKYFTIVLLAIAIGAALFWARTDMERAISAFSAVLIVACPCALALSTPFTMAAALRVFDKNKFYIKNTDMVEQLAHIDTIVFDKTGTITDNEQQQLIFNGELSAQQQTWVASLSRNSAHPLSQKIYQSLRHKVKTEVEGFENNVGLGISGTVEGNTIRMGKLHYAVYGNMDSDPDTETRVHVSINGIHHGYFVFGHSYRKDLGVLINTLKEQHELHLLSGDNEHEKNTLSAIFDNQLLHFNQSPSNKLEHIKALQQQHKTVMMIGDGLNDAGALKQSDLGIAVTENINNFSPGSDAILEASSFDKLPLFKKFAIGTTKVIKASFVISLTYNIIGLSWAVQGTLSPLTAAILMPLSTVTIISFTSLATHIIAKRRKLI